MVAVSIPTLPSGPTDSTTPFVAADRPIYLLHFIDPDGTSAFHEGCDKAVFTIAVVIQIQGTSLYRRHLGLMTSNQYSYCCTYIAFLESSTSSGLGSIGDVADEQRIAMYEFAGSSMFKCQTTFAITGYDPTTTSWVAMPQVLMDANLAGISGEAKNSHGFPDYSSTSPG